jgi:hypothetical protein
VHHRKLRSQGGQDTVENLMLVHDVCHNITPWSIHQNPARSYRLGHMVKQADDPADVPVVIEERLQELRA